MILLDKVCKKYGSKQILNNISAQFNNGTIYGIVGDNGSGKSVLLKCICGIIPYDSGAISIDGNKIIAGKEIPRIGLIIEHPGFLNSMTGFHNLKYLAGIRSIITSDDIMKAVSRVGLEPDIKKKVKKYSLGMRQKLALAQAIMEHPNTYVMDEPFNGLDKESTQKIYNLFIQLKQDGNTLILVSHHINDIDTLCDEVYEMKAGSLIKLLR